jgi:hypothetical protein
MSDPQANSVRNLSGRYHLSMTRIDAILRLKGLEESWVKVCPVPHLIFLARSWQDDVYND